MAGGTRLLRLSLLLLLPLLSPLLVCKGATTNVEEGASRRQPTVDESWTKDGPAHTYPHCVNISDADNLNHPAPDYLPYLRGSYSLTVEVVFLLKNVTLYVEEVREVWREGGVEVDMGAVHVWGNGSKAAFYYYPASGEMVEELDGVCRMTGTEVPPLNPWGWWDPVPEHGSLLYGPSAILRRAYFTNKRYMGEETTLVDGIKCDEWQTCESAGAVDVFYFFSRDPWQMPEAGYYNDTRFPVKWEVLFLDVTERIRYSVVSFLPFVRNPALGEPPRGEWCEGYVSLVPGLSVPQLPDHFSLEQEVIQNPEVDGVTLGVQHVEKLKISYSRPLSLIRYDVNPHSAHDPPFYTTARLRIVHDFNTGVEYVIDTSMGNCTMGRIKPNFYDNNYGGIYGTEDQMLGPNWMFYLYGSYALIGPRQERGQSSLLWTSTRNDIPDPDAGPEMRYPKAVLEYYFTKAKQMTADGVVEVDVPMRSDLFVYNKSDTTQVIKMVTTNFNDFSMMQLYLENEFPVQECYQDPTPRWTYFLIDFPADAGEQEAVSTHVDVFKDQLVALLVAACQISPVRVAAIDISVGMEAPGMSGRGHSSNGEAGGARSTAANAVLATVTVLDKAPYLLAYEEGLTNDPVPGDQETVVRNVAGLEECAHACSANNDFYCKGFHYCGTTCYLSPTKGMHGLALDVHDCQLYVLVITNATLQDPPTDQAYLTLLDVIHQGKFVIHIPVEDATVSLTATEALLYQTLSTDDLLGVEFSLFRDDHTLHYPDVTLQVVGLDECLKSCLSWRSFRCEMTSFNLVSHECRLSSVHYSQLNSSSLLTDTNAAVYTRNYLADYEVVLGGVSLNTSGTVIPKVDSPEECARRCTKSGSDQCQSFEWCAEARECHLHQELFLQVADGGNYTVHTACIHFSQKTSQAFTQYPGQGLPENQHSLVAQDSRADFCSQYCLQWSDQVCESFDFCTSCEAEDEGVCGQANAGLANLCFVSTHHMGEPGTNFVSAPHCRHYSREMFGDMDYAAWVASREASEYLIYTPGDMAAMALGMIVLGVVLTLGFLYLLVNTHPQYDHPEATKPSPSSSMTSSPAKQPVNKKQELLEELQVVSYVDLKSGSVGESET